MTGSFLFPFIKKKMNANFSFGTVKTVMDENEKSLFYFTVKNCLVVEEHIYEEHIIKIFKYIG